VVVSQTSGSLTRASYAASGGECDPKRFTTWKALLDISEKSFRIDPIGKL